MKKVISLLTATLMLITIALPCYADSPRKNAVTELYSIEGNYEDEIGNVYNYSYHVPQIAASSPDAGAINDEILERFGLKVEDEFTNMSDGISLVLISVSWKAFWQGQQLFLLVTSDNDWAFTDYAVYGYDFETGERITNQMILEQRGISEEEYLENLQEKVLLMCEDMYSIVPEEYRDEPWYSELYEQTLGWLDMEQPLFVDQFGQLETIVKIASPAGAGWYYHLATPFVYG